MTTGTRCGRTADPGRSSEANPDFKLPFNPLVGTNNDSLFGDVGSIGLGDLPIAAIDCPDGDKSCSPNKPEGKK